MNPLSRPQRNTGTAILVILAAMFAVRLWLLPLRNSFWLDEAVIVSIIRDRFSAVGPKAFAAFQSVLFCGLEWAVGKLLGTGEIAMRLWSVAASIGGALVFFRIGARLAGREAGVIAACLFVAFPQIADEAADARPYALGLCLEALAILALIEWTASRRLKPALFFAAAMAVAIHLHWFFAFALPAEAAYLFWKSGKPQPQLWKQIGLSCLCGGVLISPLLPQVPNLLRAAAVMQFASVPDLYDLLRFLIPVNLFIGCAGAWALAWARKSFRPPESDLLVMGLLLAGPAVCIFLLAKFSPVLLFTPRYLVAATPGVLLIWVWLLRGIEPGWVRNVSLIAGLTLSSASFGGLSFIPHPHAEDWRSAAAHAPQSRKTIIYSGLVETKRLDWLEDASHWTYLAAPVAIYRPDLSPRNTMLVPFNFAPAEQAYVESRLRDLAGPVALIVRGNFAEIERERAQGVAHVPEFSGPNWAAWISDRLAQQGFRRTGSARFGDVEVDAFER